MLSVRAHALTVGSVKRRRREIEICAVYKSFKRINARRMQMHAMITDIDYAEIREKQNPND